MNFPQTVDEIDMVPKPLDDVIATPFDIYQNKIDATLKP